MRVMIVDLRNTKTAMNRWCKVVWLDFETPLIIVEYSTSMLTRWDFPAGKIP